jgi:hypothetical protein
MARDRRRGPGPMSALLQKQTFAPQNVMCALPPKADMCGAARDVRYGPKAGMHRAITERLLTVAASRR